MENGMSGVQPVFNLNEKTTGNMSGFDGSAWLWIVVLFVLLGGGFGGLGNRGGNALTQAELQNGFNHSDTMAQIRGITYGNADATYALNNAINGLEKTVMNGNYGLQQSLCSIERNIDSIKAEGYQNTCAVVNTIKDDGEKTRAMFTNYQMQELRDRLEEKDRMLLAANMNTSQIAQTAELMGRLRPAPIPAFTVPNPFTTTTTTTTT